MMRFVLVTTCEKGSGLLLAILLTSIFQVNNDADNDNSDSNAERFDYF